MNLLPVSALAASEDVKNEWETLLAHADDAGWCFFALDVQNLYGLAFEVTLSYNSTGMHCQLSQCTTEVTNHLLVTTSRVIPPGSTYRYAIS